jgi:hypothetical protein
MTTLTGDDNFSGSYTDIFVLGAAIGGSTGTIYADTPDGGNETFMFGDLQHKSTVETSGDITSGTFQSTATGTGGDEVDFNFTFHAGTGGTSNFLTDGFSPQDYTADSDGDATYQAQSDDNAWLTNYANWQASQPAGTTYSDPVTIETGVNNGHPDPDANLTLDIQATTPGASPYYTADDGGNKILLGFTVATDTNPGDHIGLNVDKTTFEQYFTVNADTHISANNNVVNDTVISLGNFTASTGTAAGDHAYGTSEGNWSVDLYGVSVASLQTAAANAGYQGTNALSDYVYDTIVHHT